ncbi:MAG: ATP phosphoribosyltransferase regulatory subunit [Planctomycetota bacterium]
MAKPTSKKRFQPPKGTRDLYPEDMLRRRYITQAWRDTSIRHGFEEIDGPTFETSDLYAVKSGDGILGELFQAFSGKDPKDLEFIKEHDRAQLALRPEFTPTLARLYAARAAQLPKPTKWFSIGPFFRAERPQRGRLREFLQWNADVIGGGEPSYEDPADKALEFVNADFECAALCHAGTDLLFGAATLTAIHLNDRRIVEHALSESFDHSLSDKPDSLARAFALLDKRSKMSTEKFEEEASDIGLMVGEFNNREADIARKLRFAAEGGFAFSGHGADDLDTTLANAPGMPLAMLARQLNATSARSAIQFDPSIVRGLAYYTGTVFEVIAEGERAVAGGGRYDNLIELLGGPPTPAVGFAMGDVVLSLLLEDKGLMPEGHELLEACSRPPASLRPEAFVVTPDEALDSAARRLVADLRRGTETEGFDGKPWAADRYETRPLHARRTYKSTRNIGKLLKDATSQHAKTLVIVENEDHATVQDLDRKDKHERIPLADVPAKVAELT